MPVTVLIGAQWGDEGKGRYIDYLAADAQIVARYQGGDNAGHTVAIGDTVYKMHLIPSGILRPGVVAVMGNGMVINPLSLLREMDTLIAMGVDLSPENLIISSRAHIITPAHIEFDRAKELARGDKAIGTTLRGIGPAYLDKVGRNGLRMSTMLDIEQFAGDLELHLEQAQATLQKEGYEVQYTIAESVQQYVDAAERIRPFIQDTIQYLNRRLRDGARILCEGGQGTLLDVDHGSYPFVTSSSPSVGGAMTGLGIGPTYVDRVIGIAKAFSTRVGAGPMPTELFDETAARLRGTGENFWDEYGTTTGRERRCGWLDAVMLRYAAHVNGFTELCLTKLDILSGFDELKIAVAYEIDGRRVDFPPSTNAELARAKPIYETVAGWQADVSRLQAIDALPTAVLAYAERVAAITDVPVTMLSVGPEREQLITLKQPV